MPTGDQKMYILMKNRGQIGATPPPPPPPPPEPGHFDGGDHPDNPRCYFCGSLLQTILKTEYDMGNGYSKYVFICKQCKDKQKAAADAESEALRKSEERQDLIIGCVILSVLAIAAIAGLIRWLF